VKELLKIARVLYNSVRACQDAIARGEEEEGGADGEGFSLTIKAGDLAATRAMASEVTERGARLFELLRRDGELRASRAAALRFLDALSGGLDSRAEAAYLERSIRDAIAGAKDGIGALERQLAEAADDERSLESRISKRRAELDRSQKRLESLQSVRPAFMDEYERLERELAEEYDQYVLRFRNLDYLQHELEAHEALERRSAEASARSLRKLQRRLKDEEARIARGDEGGDEDDGRAGSSSPGRRRPTAAAGGTRPAASGAAAARPTGVGRANGPAPTQQAQAQAFSSGTAVPIGGKVGALLGGGRATTGVGAGAAGGGGPRAAVASAAAAAKPALLQSAAAANARGAPAARGVAGAGGAAAAGGIGRAGGGAGGGGPPSGGRGPAAAVGRMNAAPDDDDDDDDESDLDDGDDGGLTGDDADF
jgi:hypothetical protein